LEVSIRKSEIAGFQNTFNAVHKVAILRKT